MSFKAASMFPGDLFDAASRFAADTASAASARGSAWPHAVQMGWPAMLIAESLGGAGGSLVDLGAVIEANAREASVLPLVGRCATVPVFLAAAGGEAAQQCLRALAAAQMDLDVADATKLCAHVGSDGAVCVDGLLEGFDLSVPASHLLLVVQDLLLCVPVAALPPPVSRHRGIDGRITADLQLDGLQLPASAALQRGAAVTAAATMAADAGALVVSIDMAATMGALIEHTIAHLETRVQFDVALASFQVLRHRIVELYVQYESASVLLARMVADVVSTGHLKSRDASLAKLYVGDLARTAAEAAIQLHGGMGLTADLPAARLAQRLLGATFAHGGRAHHLARLQGLRADTSVKLASV